MAPGTLGKGTSKAMSLGVLGEWPVGAADVMVPSVDDGASESPPNHIEAGHPGDSTPDTPIPVTGGSVQGDVSRVTPATTPATMSSRMTADRAPRTLLIQSLSSRPALGCAFDRSVGAESLPHPVVR